MTALALMLGFTLGFSTHWAYCEIRRHLHTRAIDRAVWAFFKQEELVTSGVREMTR